MRDAPLTKMYWSDVIKAYSVLRLARPRDLVLALSGITNRLSKLPGTRIYSVHTILAAVATLQNGTEAELIRLNAHLNNVAP